MTGERIAAATNSTPSVFRVEGTVDNRIDAGEVRGWSQVHHVVKAMDALLAESHRKPDCRAESAKGPFRVRNAYSLFC